MPLYNLFSKNLDSAVLKKQNTSMVRMFPLRHNAKSAQLNRIFLIVDLPWTRPLPSGAVQMAGLGVLSK